MGTFIAQNSLLIYIKKSHQLMSSSNVSKCSLCTLTSEMPKLVE